MPGRQLQGFWEGSRSELFAIYVLSRAASVAAVPHEYDLGADLLCTLVSSEDRFLHAGRAFVVQVKSASDPVWTLGGFDDQGNWKRHEIEWLYDQDQPMLLCVVDKEALEVRLYSTSRMWGLHWHVGPPAVVNLAPDDDFTRVRGGLSLEADYSEQPIPAAADAPYRGGKNSYTIPLGGPILAVNLSEAELPATTQIHDCLKPWLDLDYRNIAYRKLRVPHVAEWVEWEVNKPPKGVVMHRYYDNPQRDKNVPELLGAIAPAVTSLLLNLRQQGQLEKLSPAVALAELAKEYNCLDGVGMNFLEKLQPGDAGETS